MQNNRSELETNRPIIFTMINMEGLSYQDEIATITDQYKKIDNFINEAAKRTAQLLASLNNSKYLLQKEILFEQGFYKNIYRILICSEVSEVSVTHRWKESLKLYGVPENEAISIQYLQGGHLGKIIKL